MDIAHVTLLYGNDETEFSKKLNFVKPAFQRGKSLWFYFPQTMQCFCESISQPAEASMLTKIGASFSSFHFFCEAPVCQET